AGMSEAIVAVKIALSELEAKLGTANGQAAPGRKLLQAANGSPLAVRGIGSDATLLFTGAPVRGTEPEEHAFVVRQLLGDLVERHGDERGLLVFPDMLRPKASSWAELVDEIGELGEWAPLVGADFVPAALAEAPAGSLEAAMGAMLNALGPDAANMSRSLMGGDPAAMQDAAQRMQSLLQSPEGQPLMRMLEQLDVGSMLEQARAAGLDVPDLEGSDDDLDDDDEDDEDDDDTDDGEDQR